MAALPVSLQGPLRDKRPRIAREGGAELGLTELRKRRGGPRVSARVASGYPYRNHPRLVLRSRDRRRRRRRRREEAAEAEAAPGDAAATPGRDPLEPRGFRSVLEVSGKARKASQQPCRVAQAPLCPHGAPRSPPRQPRVLDGEPGQLRPGAPRLFSSAGPSAAAAACRRPRRAGLPPPASPAGLGGSRVGAWARVTGDPEALAAAPDLPLTRRGAGSAKAFCAWSEEAPPRLCSLLLGSRDSAPRGPAPLPPLACR